MNFQDLPIINLNLIVFVKPFQQLICTTEPLEECYSNRMFFEFSSMLDISVISVISN